MMSNFERWMENWKRFGVRCFVLEDFFGIFYLFYVDALKQETFGILRKKSLYVFFSIDLLLVYI